MSETAAESTEQGNEPVSNGRSEPLRELGYDQTAVPAEKANQAPQVETAADASE